ncbi:MAG: hypothetical protein OEW77_08855 [Gemmatimonadota bacterium]|nr:hypothetical protein [Gemmatimonadota bacterium]
MLPPIATRVRLVALVALVALPLASGLACGEPLAPADIAGRYALVDSVTVTGPADGVETILSDTLVLEPDGSGVRRARIRRPASPSGYVVDTLVREFGYRIKGRAVGIAFGCPPTMFCAAIAYESWYDLVLDRLISRDSQGPLVYRRVSGR